MDINKVFSERLRSLREARGLSQEAVSDEIGVERQTLGNYEKGKRKPDIEVLQKIKQFFGADYEYLLGESNCQTKEAQDELKNDFSFALSLLPQDTQTAVVRSLNDISNALSSVDVSGEEAKCGRIFESLLLFVSSTMRLYSSVHDEAERVSDSLDNISGNAIDKQQILELQAHKFTVNAIHNKEIAAAEMLKFIEGMQSTLYSDVMRPFEVEV